MEGGQDRGALEVQADDPRPTTTTWVQSVRQSIGAPHAYDSSVPDRRSLGTARPHVCSAEQYHGAAATLCC